jgi:HK97 family phage prohead protease
MSENYDFQGYATKYNIMCDDGLVIRDNAFSDQDGGRVSLIWNHVHNDPEYIIGHADMESRSDGIYIRGKLNNTKRGRNCKELLESGDVTGLSIYANKLKKRGNEVLHGTIREVSLVFSGANPGALIDIPLAHSTDEEDLEMYSMLIGDESEVEDLTHSGTKDKEEEPVAKPEDTKEETKEESGKTIQEVFDTLNEDQKTAVYAIVGAIAEDLGGDGEDDEEDENGGGARVKHNAFYGNETQKNFLSHSDQSEILSIAKNSTVGSLRQAIDIFTDGDSLQHDAIASGFSQNLQQDGNISWLFPEYKDLRTGAPELITDDQSWVSTVMRKVSKSPYSRIRTSYVDIRNIDELRAKGYFKGKQKTLSGNYNLVRRTVDPQTVYVKSQLHRDDVIDITDFDYVAYQYKIDKMMLDQEIAMAIMLGDFRSDNSDDKILPAHVTPIWTDDELYTIHRDVDISAITPTLQGSDTDKYFGNSFVYSEAMIESLLFAREDYKGTGTPDMFITPHMLNVMLLARDSNGRRIYSSVTELASALNVGNIYTVEQFANRVRTDSNNNQHKLLAMVVNLADYTVGSTKGGQVSHFTDFDLNFNTLISLIETRISGALTKTWSAICLEEPVA